MRWDDIYLTGIGSWLPPAVDVRQAVADGLVSAATAEPTGFTAVTVSRDTPPMAMACRAALQALRHANTHVEDIGALVHCCGSDPQHIVPTAYLQRALTLRPDTLGFELRQASSSNLMGLITAAAHLTADPGKHSALVTYADSYQPPMWNRWNSNPGVFMGDAAAAVVLSRTHGFARLVATSYTADPRGEEAGRLAATTRLDLTIAKQQLTTPCTGPILGAMPRKTTEAVEAVLAAAGLDISNVQHILSPALGLPLLDHAMLQPLGLTAERTSWPYQRHIGHTGADQLLALAHLAHHGRLRPGEHILLISLAFGYSWTCALLETTRKP